MMRSTLDNCFEVLLFMYLWSGSSFRCRIVGFSSDRRLLLTPACEHGTDLSIKEATGSQQGRNPIAMAAFVAHAMICDDYPLRSSFPLQVSPAMNGDAKIVHVLLVSVLLVTSLGEQCPWSETNIADGSFNKENNNEDCSYDGGDCCQCTCHDDRQYACGYQGFDCRDPMSTDVFSDCKGAPSFPHHALLMSSSNWRCGICLR